jgi:hypothetical protein
MYTTVLMGLFTVPGRLARHHAPHLHSPCPTAAAQPPLRGLRAAAEARLHAADRGPQLWRSGRLCEAA